MPLPLHFSLLQSDAIGYGPHTSGFVALTLGYSAYQEF